ncbi:hypothetical protein BDV96DRAFT_646257 [Lophiotrema nucula]|uniref:Rhodopsin domain-containing protein n=1 Tax=Lophiotrema nucula TaxID=690887 RepID=A0A6A5Z853_9PLEO|nr:hypothetical protein BDV96DRAFT_646257 [Lophiotrema nucula]
MTSRSGDDFPFPYASTGDCYAIGIALPAVAMVVVGLRMYTRRTQRAALGADDWLIVGGLVSIIAMGICFIYGAATGAMGQPTPPPPDGLTDEEMLSYIDPGYEVLEKIQFPFQIFMMLAYAFIKMGIVAFYRRLFVVDKRSVFGIVTLVTQVVLVLWSLTFILLVIFPCGRHIWANWGATGDQLALCPVVFTSEYGLTGSDLILDVYIFLLPLPCVWKLHMTTQRKVMVSGILLLAAMAVAASIARLVVYVKAITLLTAGSDVDEKLVVTLGLYWSLLESGLALIAACLPTLSSLFFKKKGGKSLTMMLQSLRSVFSLRSSNRSVRSEDSQPIYLQRTFKVDVENGSSGQLAKPVETTGTGAAANAPYEVSRT